MTRSALPDLSSLASPGARLQVRVTPGARAEQVEPGQPIRIKVTVPPAGGKATDAARRLLAGALGVAPSRLRLIRGAASRDKLFQLDG